MEHSTCYTPQCSRRESCTLWHNAQASIQQGAIYLSVVNPQIIEKAGGYESCPSYYEHKLRRYARGLIWSYDELTIAQWRTLKAELNAHFGYHNMVRMRCGYEAISPEDQERIADIFARVAAHSSPRYRSYEEHYIKPPRVEGKAVHKLMNK